MSLRRDLEELVVKLERVELEMAGWCARRRVQADTKGAMHSAGIADGLAIARVALSTLLEREIEGHRLEAIR